MAVPLASSASASRSLRMICSGEWRIRFIESPPALTGENDSHIGWTRLRGAGQVRWTDLTYEQIAGHLAEAGTPVSVPVVKQLLRKHGYVTRKAQKSRAMGGHPDRNQQFENIARLKREYLASDDPIVSIDTKKKELIGDFYRAGHLLTQGVIETFDHDFPRFASGVVIPHGLYDLKRNDGHVNLGTSHDTGEFACESIERWWEGKGRALYPRAA